MARRVFFSFHYKHVWKVNQIRSMPNITGTAAAGFQDASLWEESKKKSDRAIKALIDEGLKNTSVTVVCVTYGTANGLVAVQIHHLKDSNGETGSPGAIPAKVEANGFKAYKYTNKEDLAKWIEEAAKLAGK
jgi:hypothetical protein